MAESKTDLPLTTTDANGEVHIRMDASGAGAEPAKTVMDVFKTTVGKYGDKTAMVGADGTELTFKQYYNQCRGFAKSLISLGVQPFEGVNMIGFNSKEYIIANCGAIFAGCIAAGIYTTNAPDACHYVSEHSDAAVVVCQGLKQLNKFIEIESRLPNLKALVMYNVAYDTKNGPAPVDALPTKEGGVPLYSFEDFMKLGKDVDEAALDERMNAQKPGNCCTLIYTSGTTGPPKAVMISHDNITWTTTRVRDRLALGSGDRLVSYLPLNHIAAQMLDIHAPMAFGASIFFGDPDALRGSLVFTLKKAQPTIFFGVPRVWEKMQEKMAAVAATVTGVKKKISAWCKGKGTAYANNCQFGGSNAAPTCFGCANKLAFSKVKAALGLSKCRIAATGAAPITRDTLNYFASLNIHILELFGQSECTGPATFNSPGFWKLGTCGQALDGTDMVIVPDTKEIIYRGRHIFMGYMKMPEKTAETIDAEGYLHSGDQGAIDADGFMRITGRIKELIITAGGENIPPVLIEEELLKAMPALSNACVIGDKRKYLTVLVSLKTDVDAATGYPQNTLAPAALAVSKEIGSEAKTVEEAKACAKWSEYCTNGLKAANAKTTSRAHNVQKFCILPVDFSVPGGELTATLKVRRSVVHEKYAEDIEAFYA